MSYLKRSKSSLENSILSVWSEAAKKEGNAFGMALQAAKENGDKKFTVSGKTYDVKTEMDKVNKVALGKKFKDRKDKDIDNDGDVDSSDKYLHKRRQAVSKAIKKEGAYHIAKDMSKLKKKMQSKMKYDASNFKVAIRHIGDDQMSDELQKLKPNEDMRPIIKKAMKRLGIKENFEVGTKARTDHTLKVTPGQSPEEFDQQVNVMHKKKNSMREALAKMWGIKEGQNPFDKKEQKKYNKDKKEGKTLTGKAETKVEVEPKMEKKK